jgi:hypothetical protein
MGPVLDAELYDQVTGKWISANSMVNPRSGNTATLLANGEVLITGGQNISGSILSSSEYTTQLPVCGAAQAICWKHFLTVERQPFCGMAPFLITGGWDPNTQLGSNHSELYDPSTGLWTRASEMNYGRASHSSVPLANGRILLFGGIANQPIATNSAELYRSDSSWGDYYYLASNSGARSQVTVVRVGH